VAVVAREKWPRSCWITGKDVPLSTWLNAQPWRKPCGCTRLSIPDQTASRLQSGCDQLPPLVGSGDEEEDTEGPEPIVA
jgi:hypothetical protein